MTEERIARLNELARKSKTIGLTEEEKQEQALLRQEYLAAQSGRLIRKLCGGDLHLFATALCDSGLSREELEELSRLLEEGEL